MIEKEISVLIGGRAGDGVSSAGQVIALLLARLGYCIHMYFDYPSLIKGGHNFAIIRGADHKIGAVREEVDFILALNQETLDLHGSRLRQPGEVVYNMDKVHHPDGTGIKINEILSSENAPAVMGNSVILGAFARCAAINWEIVEGVLSKAMPAGTGQNLRVARRAYDTSVTRLPLERVNGAPLPVLTGNEAIGLGLLESDLRIYYAYPMSPTSNLLHFFASNSDEFHIQAVQPESEIAVILMALGSAYTGIRAAVGTSGGGFCLMTEAVSFAGIAELPVVIVLGQRAGPSTGLATYTAQSDLHFAINAGHGDVPKFIVAPGDALEARAWSKAAMDIAWKYQLPAIVLSDRIICEGLYSLGTDEHAGYAVKTVFSGEEAHPYRRYALTDTGISPLLFPPEKGEVIRVNSHVHDTDGITAEEPGITRLMAEKRMKKMICLKEEAEAMHPVNTGGVPDAPDALLCWGSGKGVCNETGEKMGLRVIQPVVLWPFPEKSFSTAMDGVERFYSVEINETGQLARLVSQFGYTPETMVLKYDGRPFMVGELEKELRRVVK